uniref:Uncharacterized protein n=1 Tax=Romanomermis culicivorax TaxID=13658 RepID=A0A915IQ23_ROMCU
MWLSLCKAQIFVFNASCKLYNFAQKRNVFTADDKNAARYVAVLPADVYTFDGFVICEIYQRVISLTPKNK